MFYFTFFGCFMLGGNLEGVCRICGGVCQGYFEFLLGGLGRVFGSLFATVLGIKNLSTRLITIAYIALVQTGLSG